MTCRRGSSVSSSLSMCPIAPKVHITATTALFQAVQSFESVRMGIKERVEEEVVYALPL